MLITHEAEKMMRDGANRLAKILLKGMVKADTQVSVFLYSTPNFTYSRAHWILRINADHYPITDEKGLVRLELVDVINHRKNDILESIKSKSLTSLRISSI